MAAPDVFTRLAALSDPTRARLLAVLEDHELTVRELCSVTQLPQSTVSRHLKVLGAEGWVTVRGAGTSRFYRMAIPRTDRGPRRLWSAVRAQVGVVPAARQDARRLNGVLRLRRDRSQHYFSTVASDWTRVRSALVGPRNDLLGLLDLLDPSLVVGDLGCGAGAITEALAPCVARVVAVDESRAMLAAVRRKLAHAENVDVRPGSLEALPIAAGELDVAVMCLVLRFVLDPPRVLAEARRVLRPDGRLLLMDCTPYDADQYAHDAGHVWPGFDDAQVTAWLRDVGFRAVRYRELPADPAATGPVLFAALAHCGRE